MTELAQTYARALVRLEAAKQVSGVAGRALVRMGNISTQVSHVTARMIVKRVALIDSRWSQLFARSLIRVSPNFRWIDMFSDLVFPHNISENSDAATKFSTLVNQVASGHDQRAALWDHPLMEYNVAYGVRTMEQLHDLIRFFRVMRGKLIAFRFLDNIDYTSNFATYEEARAPEEIEPTDQLIGVGDEINLSFQLVKHYDFETETTTRPIYKPIPDTVIVAVAGVEIDHFTCDHSTGVVTIQPRVSAALDRVTLARVDPGDNTLWSLTVPFYAPPSSGTLGDQPLPILVEDEWFDTTGLPTNVTKGVVVSSSETELIFEWSGVDETAEADDISDVVLVTNNVPRTGQQVTAGFHFHVPVRFDTDRIPVKLEYYGVGSAQEIKLVEVRPEEE